MKKIESIIKGLTDEQLKEAFNEIVEWREDGLLLDGVVRNAYKEFMKTNNTSFGISEMENPILFEIATRHYN